MTQCSISDCPSTASRRGWCQKHYRRWSRHGDPLSPDKSRNPRRSIPTYRGAHTRVRARRGKARNLPCINCGNPATAWAYQGTDPNPLVSPRGYLYSVDPAHYAPMCTPCHATLDAEARTACRNGHARTDVNGYWHRRRWVCRPCRRAGNVRFRQRLKSAA